MSGQSWPQSRSGRSSPRVWVAKNHAPRIRRIAPKNREALRPLSDGGGRQAVAGARCGAAGGGGGSGATGGGSSGAAAGGTVPPAGGVGERVVSESVIR